MSEIGPTLRQARMREGWDITEVEERTKIRAKYLRALENEEWSLLPGATFTKGFLRTYAEALGLDWRLLVDEYKREWEAPNELEHVPVRPSMALDPRERTRRRAWRWIGALALIVALAVVFVLIGHLGGASKTGTPPPTRGSSSGLGGATATTGRTTPQRPRELRARIGDLCPRRLRVAARSRHAWRGSGRASSATGTCESTAHAWRPACRRRRFHARRFVVTLGSRRGGARDRRTQVHAAPTATRSGALRAHARCTQARRRANHATSCRP